jgi:hypothetical protein
MGAFANKKTVPPDLFRGLIMRFGAANKIESRNQSGMTENICGVSQ